MTNKFTVAISILLLSAILPACKFTLGGSDTASNSGSTNSTNRSTVKTDNKTVSNDKKNLALTSEDVSESQSSTSETADFTVRRSFYALDENKPDDMGSRDGDYTYFRELENGGTAGFLYTTRPEEAVYVLWGGKVIAGPLKTVAQVEEVSAMLSNERNAEHETMMGIIRRYPTGQNVRYRVYDSDGKLIREE